MIQPPPDADEARRCTAELGFRADSLTRLRAKEDAVTWRCLGPDGTAILKWYRGVDAGLTATQRCRKSALAAAELEALGIPTPSVRAASPATGAILFDEAEPRPWTDEARNAAAATLRRLHGLDWTWLSRELRGLLEATEPNRARIARGVRMFLAELDTSDPAWRSRAQLLGARADAVLAAGEPRPEADELRLVHGDYFSANLLAGAAGVQVVDWDRLGIGDPAWDLGFLVGAEPAVSAAGKQAALAAYGPRAAGVERRLRWHLQCWESFWALRALLPRHSV